MNNFSIKIIIDKVYYVKYYCWSRLWWKILYSFFVGFYIFVCCIPKYTMFIYLLELKKIISFSYNKDLESMCVYIHIKVDCFVHMYITYFRIRKKNYYHTHTYIMWIFFRVMSICNLSLSWHYSSILATQNS